MINLLKIKDLSISFDKKVVDSVSLNIEKGKTSKVRKGRWSGAKGCCMGSRLENTVREPCEIRGWPPRSRGRVTNEKTMSHFAVPDTVNDKVLEVHERKLGRFCRDSDVKDLHDDELCWGSSESRLDLGSQKLGTVTPLGKSN